MHLSSVILLGLVQLRVALSRPLKQWDDSDLQAKHAWSDIPRGWERYGDVPKGHTINLRIGLKQDRLDQLITNLYEVSNPEHERYGVHLSKEEVDALVAPHPSSLSLVESWLAFHDIDAYAVQHSGASSWLSVNLPVAQVEQMLGAKYSVYFNPSTHAYVVRTLTYSLPRELHPHIDVVSPTTYFGSLKEMRATSFVTPKLEITSSSVDVDPNDTSPTSCSRAITPACLRSLYNTSTYTSSATRNNSLGITGYLGEHANSADLQTFYITYRPEAKGTTFNTVLVNGGTNNQSDPGLEANLDVQYAGVLSYPISNVFYSTGGSPPFLPDSATPTNTNEPYLEWLDFVLAQTTIPQTFSTSYGDDEQTVPYDYANRVCSMLAQLGARGSSVLFASGDGGVGPGSCQTNQGIPKRIFQPSFPATCPFVTAVGGTTKIPEVAARFSGGGFSNYFRQPSYQSSMVNGYLSAFGNTYAGLYNRTGRAYPDVAAQADNFQIIVNGKNISVAGTSCSAPTVAAIVALLNDVRISEGKASLGFLNPFLYSSGAAGLNDIVEGSNPGCLTEGFTARTGWDPVTGLGTLNFGRLRHLV